MAEGFLPEEELGLAEGSAEGLAEGVVEGVGAGVLSLPLLPPPGSPGALAATA